MFKKNTAVTGFTVGLVSATDGSDITTGTPVGYYTLDGGTQTAIGDVTPVHEGNGQWSFDLLAAEMNGDIVGLTFTHTSAISAHFTIKTDTSIPSDLSTEIATVDSNVDAILVDTGTTIPATIATAQTDLDTITGADGVALASTQQSITFQPMTITAGGGTDNLLFTGTGSGDGIAFDRSGAGDPLDADFIGQINATVDTALTDYDAATGTEAAAIKAETALIVADTNELQTNQGNWLTATGFATEAKQDIIDTNVDAILLDTADMQPRVVAIETDTSELQVDWTNGGRLDLLLDQVITDIAALNNISTAQVNAEIVDALNVDTYAESASVPAATASLVDKIRWLATLSRNKITQTATTQLVRNDADGATVGTSTVSDDATTYVRGEFV